MGVSVKKLYVKNGLVILIIWILSVGIIGCGNAVAVAGCGNATVASACGNNIGTSVSRNNKSTIIFKNEKINSYIDPKTNHLFVDLEVELVGNEVIFPNLSLSIGAFNKPKPQLGSARLGYTLEGKSMLFITTDITGVLAENSPSNKLLPNGMALPVKNLDYVYAVPVGASNSKFYVGSSNGIYQVGIVIAAREFDDISEYVARPNFFNSLSGGHGVAGTFSGNVTETSGIGIFMPVPY